MQEQNESEPQNEDQKNYEAYTEFVLTTMNKEGDEKEKSNEVNEIVLEIYQEKTFKNVVYFYNFTDWYVSLLIKQYRTSETTEEKTKETKEKISSFIAYSIQQISTLFEGENPIILFINLATILVTVFNDYDSGYKIMEVLVREHGDDISYWNKYIDFMIIEMKSKKELIDRNEMMNKIRKLYSRMIFVMIGSMRNKALECCNNYILFEQLYGDDETLTTAMNLRLKTNTEFDEREKRLLKKYEDIKKKKQERYQHTHSNHDYHDHHKHHDNSDSKVMSKEEWKKQLLEKKTEESKPKKEFFKKPRRGLGTFMTGK